MPRFHLFMLLAVCAGCLLPFFPDTAHAEIGLRDALKARLIKKMADKAVPDSESDVSVPITTSGDYTFTITYDDISRAYLVHVPPSYNPARPMPLLFAFHGGGGDMNYQADDTKYGLISKSDKEGFIVVFPNGVGAFSSTGKLATWNAGICCGKARDENIDDVGFVRTIVTNITRQMNVDRSKIFATGMSNGGMMVQRLACEMADVFAGIASVTGTDSTTYCRPSRPIPVLHIHALNDDHVLFNGGAGKDAFRDPSKVADFISVPETIKRWVGRNHCAPTPVRVLSNEGAYCDLYSNCAGGVHVKLCVTETGGHSWPGGVKTRGNEPTSKAISANDQMWNFFMGRVQ
ncbi:MAG: PHB depolymerase family esterase [Pseudobdellovibrionaceae bacterium]